MLRALPAFSSSSHKIKHTPLDYPDLSFSILAVRIRTPLSSSKLLIYFSLILVGKPPMKIYSSSLCLRAYSIFSSILLYYSLFMSIMLGISLTSESSYLRSLPRCLSARLFYLVMKSSISTLYSSGTSKTAPLLSLNLVMPLMLAVISSGSSVRKFQMYLKDVNSTFVLTWYVMWPINFKCFDFYTTICFCNNSKILPNES